MRDRHTDQGRDREKALPVYIMRDDINGFFTISED